MHMFYVNCMMDTLHLIITSSKKLKRTVITFITGYGKVSEPSLSEIQEVQSASFLSFREILNY